MKFTKSKDGLLRTNVQIKYRIGRDDMIHLVAWNLVNDGAIGLDLQDGSLDASDLDELSRVRVATMCRDTLNRVGQESWGDWSDDVAYETRDAIEEWVTEEIDRLFPELS